MEPPHGVRRGPERPPKRRGAVSGGSCPSAFPFTFPFPLPFPLRAPQLWPSRAAATNTANAPPQTAQALLEQDGHAPGRDA